MDEKVYKVTFSYSVWVKSDNEDDAEEQGIEEFIANNPEWRDMGREVEEETNQDWIEELGL